MKIMAVHQESLRVIEKLLDKDPKKLNALDVAMANKHLLNIYEFFQNINPVKDGVNEKVTEKKDIESGKPKKSQKIESLGLFEINLLDNEVEDTEAENSEINEALEETDVVELEEGLKSEMEESEDENVLNKLSIAFEPPVSHEDWVPTQMSSIFDDNTKSEFTFIEKDLQLEKKQTGNFDIRNMIGLNDRYLYSNELFSDKKTYESVLDQLNTFTTKEEAISYLKPYLEREVEDVDEEKNIDEVRMSFDKLLDSFYKR